MPKNIFYTGIGSSKSGKYTEKQFLKIMNKEFKQKCAMYKKSLKCKSCKKSFEINNKEIKKFLKKYKKNKTRKTSSKIEKVFKMSSKIEKEYLKQLDNCHRCKKKNTTKCNLDDYIVYSGAEIS